VVTDEFVDSCPNQDCVFLVLEDFEVSFGGEDSEDPGDNSGASGELILSSLIKAESSDGIGNGLNYLQIQLSEFIAKKNGC
jgi:hypothetical protein